MARSLKHLSQVDLEAVQRDISGSCVRHAPRERQHSVDQGGSISRGDAVVSQS